jgi:hypothetical protein
VIQAADAIEFTPARSGKPGRRTIAEALGSAADAAVCLVNGAPVGPGYELRPGDAVVTNAIVPVKATVSEAADSEAVSSSHAAGADSSSAFSPDSLAREGLSTHGSAGILSSAADSAANREAGPAPIPQPSEEALPPRLFFLNEAPLELPAKPKGAPYYLMDLLEYAGLDFEHLDRPVTLRVNGENGSFMRVLADGDRVSIRLEEPRA